MKSSKAETIVKIKKMGQILVLVKGLYTVWPKKGAKSKILVAPPLALITRCKSHDIVLTTLCIYLDSKLHSVLT